MRILLAHHDEKMRDLLQVLLEESGYQVIESPNDIELFKELSLQAGPDVLMSSPKIEGQWLDISLRRVLRIRPVPVVFTARRCEAEEARLRCRDYVMTVVSEPFTQSDLRPAIQHVVRRFRQLQALKAENRRLKHRFDALVD